MNNRERFWGVINRTRVDRLPVIEWAPWWKDATIPRWYEQGLPRELTTDAQISGYFGLDDWRLVWLNARSSQAPKPAHWGAPLVRSREEYEAFQHYLWQPPENGLAELHRLAADHAAGRCVVWVALDGFYWLPQRLLGIEQQLLAYYDHPDLIKAINARLVEFHLECLGQVAAILKPDFFTFAEDFAYNNGPMISERLFDEFMAPYYRQVVPRIKELGSLALTDSDGRMDTAVPWLLKVGLDGLLPLERQAGVDVAALRHKHPHLVMVGAFDKMTMSRGREAMRREFDRLLPLMASGRYLPGCDHQTPPEVTLENYRIYLELFREYADRAVEDWP
jgi:hypothetical protein